ncbi:afadin-like [Gigantopelta aegis]|uniref:afadin-like n=1 Tax=Gigantopelta aegis TaxID=1735272 RepID=UPI001B88B4FA|nr:afadin-like [Gigantopelta aegis]
MSMGQASEDRQRLIQLIKQWNVDHYDIFELSPPNEDNEFHGVVRFFFQGGGANVVTKCIRVASDATTAEVIEVLVEKFRPDMRMLTQGKYALYEVHVNGEERKLELDEKPLWVQLNWGLDVREGRFLLKREDEKTAKGATGDWNVADKAQESQPGFKRKLSKREKKEKKKREKDKNKENVEKGGDSVAEKLYNDLPETSFTRSISNPEAVMRRRRQQKLDKKLEQMRGQEGNQESGGTLKIYGESVRPDIPYKTLLLSTSDTTEMVVREAMEKYGLDKEDPEKYCLVQVVVPPGGLEYHGGQMGEERIMADDECPLLVIMQHPKNRGHIIFQLRHRPNNYQQPTKKRQRAVSHDDIRFAHEPKHVNLDQLPYLIELNSRVAKPRRHVLPINVTEVGSERSLSTSGQYLQLYGGDVMPRHCVIAHTEGIVTVTPTSREAETYVDRQRIYETTMLKHGMTVQFGKSYAYRFCDPRFEDPSHRFIPPDVSMHKPASIPHETNFDLDGHIETIGQEPTRGAPPMDKKRVSMDLSKSSEPQQSDVDLLPASLEFRNNEESPLLPSVILNVNSRAVQFKLAPTYSLYMGMRHCLVQAKHPELSAQHRAQRAGDFISRMSKMVQQAIQENHNDPTTLAFWMANSSEVLHFIKQDRDLQSVSMEWQEVLAEAVQMAFQHLVRCLQVDLHRVMPAFLDPSDAEEDDDRRDMHQQQYNQSKPILADVLNTLSAAMTLLRRCRVNAALTIQLFSQLFHFINMWLFNILVTEPQLQLCTRAWGIRLKRRLGRIEAWAEKQGLELAADCHLCRIIQAAHFLQASKSTADDITNISSTCFKLNSMQFRVLLMRYIPEPSEPLMSPVFIDRIVSIAENMADELTRTDGREVRLEEDQDLHLPFLLPEDGYSCDTIRGIPNGLPDFLKPLQNQGLCYLIPNNASNGSWTVYMGEGKPLERQLPKDPMPNGLQSSPTQPIPQEQKSPEVMTVIFKKVKGSMGLSIVAARGEGQRERGIYIKSVVPGGAAALDGRLQAGDQLLEVDGMSLVGLTQDKAAELMTRTGLTVTLKVAKQGAIFHGLATLLSQPSPTMQRAGGTPQKGPGSSPVPQMNNNNLRNKPHLEDGPPPYNDVPQDMQDQGPGPHRMVNEGPRKQPSPKIQGPLLSAGQSPQQGPPPGRGQQEHPHVDDRLRYAMGATETQGHPNPHRPHDPNPHRPHDPNLHRPHDPNLHHRDMQDKDPRSKSTSNLHSEPQFEQHDPRMMKPAASVAALGPGSHGGYAQGPRREEYSPYTQKVNDYENQPNMNTYPNATRADKPGPGFQDINQNMVEAPPGMKPGHYHSQPHLHPNQPPPNDRSSMSSKASNTSSRENRPQSAYYDPHWNRDEFGGMRPKSDEITPNRIREWQEKLEDPRSAHFRGNQMQDPQQIHSPSSPNSSHYQTGPPMSPGYQQGGPVRPPNEDIPKVTLNNTSRQPNFYENTMPVQKEPQPPFHQLHRPEERPRPAVAPKPKPFVAPKPSQQRVQHADVPFSSMDNRQTQPQFFDSKPAAKTQPQSPNLYHPQATKQPAYQQINKPPDKRPAFVQPKKYSPDRHSASYGYRNPNEMQSPLSNDTPPDLPPPPSPEDIHDNSPPLPPPPSQDYTIEQQLQDEQRRLMNQLGGQLDRTQNNQYGSSMDSRYPEYNPQQTGQFQERPPEPRVSLFNGPASQQSNVHPNYQNISFPGAESQQPPPVPQPPAEHNLYESYEPRRSESNFHPPEPHPSAMHLTVHEKEYTIAASPWDREEREKVEAQKEEELARLREAEIAELESKTYLNPQEQDRLRKLRLEHEFQKRVRETSDRDDDDDSDSEAAERLYSRDRMIQVMKEDLEKSKARMMDLERKRLVEEFEAEKDRLIRLEQRLQQFEKDREEHKKRILMRQEMKQKENEEYLRKQREMRENQRLKFEERKRLLMMEEEKMKQRREEELAKKRQMEREQRQEMQAARDAEEAALRAQIRKQEEEASRQRMMQQRQERLDQQREIRVADERRRLNSANQNPPGGYGNYQQYANLPPQQQQQGAGDNLRPPAPPERNSSYEFTNRGPKGHQYPGVEYQDEPQAAPKKSVSFNTRLETRNIYSVRSMSESDPDSQPGSVSSYRTSQSDALPGSPLSGHQPQMNEVFHSPPENQNMANNVKYVAAETTPGVVGTQEVYRDPRARIAAEKAANSIRKPGPERMSFRDKMKYFAVEAGENTIKLKPKVSKTQRQIESQLHTENGQ